MCPASDIVKLVEVQCETFNPRNEHAKINELCDGEEVNFTFGTQRTEDKVEKGRTRHHKAGIALLQRPLIIRHAENDARDLHSHPGIITSNPFHFKQAMSLVVGNAAFEVGGNLEWASSGVVTDQRA